MRVRSRDSVPLFKRGDMAWQISFQLSALSHTPCSRIYIPHAILNMLPDSNPRLLLIVYPIVVKSLFHPWNRCRMDERLVTAMFDLIFVGAGPHGLISAHAPSRIKNCELRQSVWSWVPKASSFQPSILDHRSFTCVLAVEHLTDHVPTRTWWHSPLRNLKYSVFPMPLPETSYVELFGGGHVSEYLEAFA